MVLYLINNYVKSETGTAQGGGASTQEEKEGRR